MSCGVPASTTPRSRRAPPGSSPRARASPACGEPLPRWWGGAPGVEHDVLPRTERVIRRALDDFGRLGHGARDARSKGCDARPAPRAGTCNGLAGVGPDLRSRSRAMLTVQSYQGFLSLSLVTDLAIADRAGSTKSLRITKEVSTSKFAPFCATHWYVE